MSMPMTFATRAALARLISAQNVVENRNEHGCQIALPIHRQLNLVTELTVWSCLIICGRLRSESNAIKMSSRQIGICWGCSANKIRESYIIANN